ncbi:MAG: cell wall hydrolase [Sphingobium sp.]
MTDHFGWAILAERVRRIWPAIILGAGGVVIALALWLVSEAPPEPHKPSYSADAIRKLADKVSGKGEAMPDPDVIPEIRPTDYYGLPEDVARRVNALIPFSRAPNPSARPFLLNATPQEFEKARTCLAIAGYYEAGDDPAGQAAVAQVVLNRLRHPAFPKTVCGVVFQGSERQTGCQFSFTCDGSMQRRVPSAPALARARATANWALTSGIFSLVGQATHYHTDYVLPKWSGEMDKIVAFHGHLFFRWRGRWGQPAAFAGQYAGPEVLDPRLLSYVDQASMAASVPQEGEAIAGLAPPAPGQASVRQMVDVAGKGRVEASGSVIRGDDARHVYYVYFGGEDYPGTYAVTAWKVCAGKSPCTVYGWRSLADIPAVVVGAAPANHSFMFSKNEHGAQQSLWNCNQIQRDNPAQCIPGTLLASTVK